MRKTVVSMKFDIFGVVGMPFLVSVRFITKECVNEFISYSLS
jgi:hypothetical protein